MPLGPIGTNLEYFDGFDDYNASQATRYWAGYAVLTGWDMTTVGGADSSLVMQAGGGRIGTASARFSAAGRALVLGVPPLATRTVGVAYKPGALATGILGFYDSGQCQCALVLQADGTLAVSCAGTVLGASTFVLGIGTWYYIEVTLTVDPSVGSAVVRVDGNVWINLSGKVTRRTGNSWSNQVAIGTIQGNGVAVDYDDFYSRSDTTFCGDCRVETRLPTGPGASTNFTHAGTSDTGTNWGNVADNPATDDAGYVQSGTAGDTDLYTYPNLATGAGTIYGVMALPLLKNDAAGTVQAAAVYRPGAAENSAGTVYPGATQVVGSTTYAVYGDILGMDPATGAAWTVAQVNNCQFGVKRIA